MNKVTSLYQEYDLELPEKVRRFSNKKQSKLKIRKFNEAKTSIKKKINDAISTQNSVLSEGKIWSNINETSIKSKTRKIYVANFRKLSGHDLLYKHLHRMGIVSSPTCIFCHKLRTIKHRNTF